MTGIGYVASVCTMGLLVVGIEEGINAGCLVEGLAACLPATYNNGPTECASNCQASTPFHRGAASAVCLSVYV